MQIILTIRGLVQGVGFRPFICCLAKEMNLKGDVCNQNNGVCIRLRVSAEKLILFRQRIETEKPTVARIHTIGFLEVDNLPFFDDFSIITSCSVSEEVTQVAPDIAVCNDCLADMRMQKYRINYPFINCTHCGPRFTIIKSLPYDRVNTTMLSFKMCAACKLEYTAPEDRRFHAQPVACNTCGPFYYCTYQNELITDYERIIALTTSLIRQGEILAVKGTGGYHLVCDAQNDKAVTRLRALKKRDGKPFAVMFRSLERLTEYAFVNEKEQSELQSWRRSVVLLRERKKLSEGINNGLHTLGCMLPYMPVHYHWFESLSADALVVTSGNLSDVPILIVPEEAEKMFGGKISLILHHNRDIYNRADDSVVQICGDKTCLIRRSRGYVPEPFFADVKTEGILAFGAEKVNTFALGKDDTIIQSQYIGDLKNWETYNFYTESLHRFRELFRFTPRSIVCDLHPDYLSSREAGQYALTHALPLYKVQHHHAHAVACMLEHGIHEQVIAVILDGTGAGVDGKTWGGEFFYCNRTSFQRLSHFEYVPMPGADRAAKEPWRMAVAFLYHYGLMSLLPKSFSERIGPKKIEILLDILSKEINTPYTSGAGRLFDAVSSLLGLCDIASFQAEAPVRLEQAASDELLAHYVVFLNREYISFGSLFAGILEDMKQNKSIASISAKFHNTLVRIIVEQCKILLHTTGATTVIASGGCLQNKRLTEQLQVQFACEQISFYIPERIPCNDGGVAVGQLAVVAAIQHKDK